MLVKEVHARIFSGKGSWKERFSVPENMEPAFYVRSVIQQFNDTLRPHEVERSYGGLISKPRYRIVPPEHDWEKQNLVTLKDGTDSLKCNKCGATAKRYGLTRIVRDKKYSGPEYAKCKGGK